MSRALLPAIIVVSATYANAEVHALPVSWLASNLQHERLRLRGPCVSMRFSENRDQNLSGSANSQEPIECEDGQGLARNPDTIHRSRTTKTRSGRIRQHFLSFHIISSPLCARPSRRAPWRCACDGYSSRTKCARHSQTLILSRSSLSPRHAQSAQHSLRPSVGWMDVIMDQKMDGWIGGASGLQPVTCSRPLEFTRAHQAHSEAFGFRPS